MVRLRLLDMLNLCLWCSTICLSKLVQYPSILKSKEAKIHLYRLNFYCFYLSISRDFGVTFSASAQCWEGNGLNSWPKLQHN